MGIVHTDGAFFSFLASFLLFLYSHAIIYNTKFSLSLYLYLLLKTAIFSLIYNIAQRSFHSLSFMIYNRFVCASIFPPSYANWWFLFSSGMSVRYLLYTPNPISKTTKRLHRFALNRRERKWRKKKNELYPIIFHTRLK